MRLERADRYLVLVEGVAGESSPTEEGARREAMERGREGDESVYVVKVLGRVRKSEVEWEGWE